jgi:hypothetical protein
LVGRKKLQLEQGIDLAESGIAVHRENAVARLKFSAGWAV